MSLLYAILIKTKDNGKDIDERLRKVVVLANRTDKVTRVLMLYHRLLDGEYINKSLFCMEHNIDARSFDRDVEDIRLFLSDLYSGDELAFDRDENAYHLTGKRPTYMDRMEATAISKIVLESRTLRSDEMDGLFQIILSMVKEHDKKPIEEYLSYDVENYSSKTKNAILKYIGDLYAILKAGYDIEIEFENDNNGIQEKIKVSPVNLVCIENEFVLIVAQEFSLEKIREISLDKIKGFNKLNTTFAQGIRAKYYKKREE